MYKCTEGVLMEHRPFVDNRLLKIFRCYTYTDQKCFNIVIDEYFTWNHYTANQRMFRFLSIPFFNWCVFYVELQLIKYYSISLSF